MSTLGRGDASARVARSPHSTAEIPATSLQPPAPKVSEEKEGDRGIREPQSDSGVPACPRTTPGPTSKRERARNSLNPLPRERALAVLSRALEWLSVAYTKVGRSLVYEQ